MTGGEPRATSAEELAAAAALGMSVAYHAARAPDRMAIVSRFGDRTYGELNAEINRLARALRASGVGRGDAVAVLLRNRPEFVAAVQAALRTGARVTPINWHLLADEVAYIVDDCEARVLIAGAEFEAASAAASDRAERLERRFVVGGELEGFEPYADVLAGLSPHDLADPTLGTSMLYTSGTTGRPKGVFRQPNSTPTAGVLRMRESADLRAGEDTALVTGPLYHAAPLALNLLLPLGAGVGSVLMDKWDAEETLALVDRHCITHSHLVATMFHRLLQLPEEVKGKYELSSLRWIIHGAAPCPAHVKQAMIDWLGPILVEYYAATEGGTFFVESEEWLTKPGSVGRAVAGTVAKLLDDEGSEVAQGEVGTIYFEAPEVGRFEYFKAPEKTAAAYRGDFFTMGDMGYLDEDGYLFLTGRSAEVIIAGGVNIYPQEVDDVLHQHPAVHEVCTIGVPDDEWGESVKSVVELRDGFEECDALAEDLLQFGQEHLPDYKRPRSIDFARDLPRLPTGKIQRHKVRQPYWAGRSKSV